MPIRHSWSDEEMIETLQIVSRHPPGPRREAAADKLVATINSDPTNRINPAAIGQALRAAEHALAGRTDARPRPSKRLLALVPRFRAAAAKRIG